MLRLLRPLSEEKKIDLAIDYVAASGIADELQRDLVPTVLGPGGRLRTQVAYTVHSLLSALLYLALCGGPYHQIEVLNTIWVRMNERQRERCGVGGLVTDESLEKWMDPKSNFRDNAYKRYYDVYSAVIALMDPSPLPGRRVKKRLNSELTRLTEAVTPAEQAAADQRRHKLNHVANRLLSGSIRKAPPWYGGDLVIDATLLRLQLALAGTSTTDPDKPYAAVAESGWWHKFNDHTVGYGFALHLCQPTHKLYGPEVCKQVTAIYLDRPSGGDVDAVRVLLDEHRKNMPRATSGRRRPQAVVDRGYSNLDGIAPLLLDEGYDIVQDYIRQNVPGSSGRLTHKRDDVAGVTCSHGKGWCPLARRHLKNWLTAPNSDPRKPGAEADPRYPKYEMIADMLEPMMVGTNGPPRRYANGGAQGRPSKATPPAPDLWAMTCFCPASEGKIRCPLSSPSMELDPRTVPTADPTDVPDGRHLICNQKSVTIKMTKKEVKWMQKYIYGSYAWTDRFGASRSRNEQFHAEIKRCEAEGADLAGKRFATYTLPAVTLITTMACIATNLRLDGVYELGLDDEGNPPLEDRVQYRQARDRNRELFDNYNIALPPGPADFRKDKQDEDSTNQDGGEPA